MDKRPFSLSTDGSTDKSKMYPIVVRHFDEEAKEIAVSFLSIPNCNTDATGEGIFQVLHKEMQKRALSWSDCIAFGSDNASVMTGCKKGCIAFIRNEHSNVYLSGCPCHLLHICAEKAGHKFEAGVEEIVVDIFSIWTRAPKECLASNNFRVGGGAMIPPWDLGRGSRDRRENLHNGSVWCNLQNYIFRFSKKAFFYYIN